MIHRVMEMQHFVEHHVFEGEPGGARIVEDTAYHDHLVRGVEMAEPGAGADSAPPQAWTRHHPSEVTLVEVVEDFFKIVRGAL